MSSTSHVRDSTDSRSTSLPIATETPFCRRRSSHARAHHAVDLEGLWATTATAERTVACSLLLVGADDRPATPQSSAGREPAPASLPRALSRRHLAHQRPRPANVKMADAGVADSWTRFQTLASAEGVASDAASA